MLFAIFVIALYIRIQLPYASSIHGGQIVISDFDPYYHLRILEYTTANFPHVLAFDPYIDYPNGFWIGWPPFFDFLAASYALVMMALFRVNYEVGVATFPALLGALSIFPVYLITKKIFDWKAGIAAAGILTILPANLLRSMVANLNHHVAAEVFFPLLIMLFLMLALRGTLTFNSVKRLQLSTEQQKTVIYSVLAGLFITALLLTWLGGFLFLGIIGIFAIIQFILYHLRGQDSENLTIVGVIMLVSSLLTLAPVSLTTHFGRVIDTLHLSLFQPLLVALFLVAFGIIGFSATFMKNMRRIYYPITIIGLVVIGSLAVYLIKPDLAISVFSGYGFFTRSGVLQTIAEAQPLFTDQTGIQLNTVASYFQLTLFLAFFGLLVLVYRVYKHPDEPSLLLIVWSAVAFAITIVQTRFTHLLSVNVAILSGYVVAWMMNAFCDTAYQKLSDLRDQYDFGRLFRREVKYTQVVGVFLVILFILVPSVNETTFYAKNVGDISPDWRESLLWMRDNTPQTSNYNVTSSQKPEYGVLSWWDYGNWIVYIGHRPAVANNFQTGVDDAAHFFTRLNESDTLQVIENRNVKYVMTDYEMAGGKFAAIALLSGEGVDTFFTTQPQSYQGRIVEQTVPNELYQKTVVAKMQYDDGNGYSHYRLIHESPNTAGTFGGADVKAVKTFEVVKGAKITVTGTGNATISLNVTTNQNRTFTYTQSAPINGTHTFIVPYSTEGMPYGIKTDSAYTISVGNSTKTLSVKEDDVIRGNELKIDF